MKYIISACLIGENCKYNGGNNLNERIRAIYKKTDSVAVCPEVLGGLGVPRARTELCKGAGDSVICGEAKVINEEHIDVTDALCTGSQRTLATAIENGITHAILKARSPSCGCGTVYDGSFTGSLQHGDGVCTALLKQNGFTILTEETI